MNAPNDLQRIYQPRRPGRAVTVASLNTHATYQTPTGRLCQLLPRRGTAVAPDHFQFVYTDGPASRAKDPLDREGFSFSAANIRLLREALR